MKIFPHFIWNTIDDMSYWIKKKVYFHTFRKMNHDIGFHVKHNAKILVAASEAGIGNAVEATGLVHAIRILWPKCHLTFVTPYAELFENWCVPDRIIADPEAIRGEVFGHTFFAYFYEKIGPWKEKCSLGTLHYPRVWLNKWFLKNEREYYVDMARRCGYQGPCPASYVAIKKPAVLPPFSDHRICIAACGKKDSLWRHKRWPYYSKLVEILLKKYPDVQICILGTQDDEMPHVPTFSANTIVDLRGAYTLTETAWLMRHSDVVVGNDCGPMHIADAVQAKGIMIFGPTCLVKNGPKNKVIPVSLNRKCSPCQYVEAIEICENPECMRNLTVELIMKKVDSMLNK